ncbi:hypothetical protein LW81_142 [Lactococcus phage LW81]|uniref:Uncharacterized protein n=1 Tax=Lactococcus phage LW81 TaxID=1965482 RepID=A0A1W6JNC3_9CAUD|nr:hypothetical protein H1Z34_gp129 [Lactococcus phage LW81]ARM67712.1 hypothetical protein LW81_142 [Lactococcus phage LW81]
MKINLNNEELLQSTLEPQEFKDVNLIFVRLASEGLSPEDWYLTEIPSERVYLFENTSGDKFFDIYFLNDNIVRPQYFKSPENWNGKEGTYINIHDAQTIKEAVEKYEVGE